MQVVAVGRDAKRGADVVAAMAERGGTGHSFVSADSFSLGNVRRAASHIRSQHEAIDVLVMSQGMATIQGFTATVDGNDEKLGSARSLPPLTRRNSRPPLQHRHPLRPLHPVRLPCLRLLDLPTSLSARVQEACNDLTDMEAT